MKNFAESESLHKRRIHVPVLVIVVLIVVIAVLASIIVIPLLGELGDGTGDANGGQALANGCSEGYLSSFRCSATSTHVERQFQNADCTVEWKQFQYCPDGCSGGACL